ncbi:hypothetical protein [Chryseobacterium sp.]|uniref:hypothetical protein n=1 Tax=Chryseobacterium sp. TaxID=1871047 RepID=UPI0011C99D06|nr:hypothetical protein [Chryseobacterium sp.]TXF77276.1 hypothetical protein FUA25_04880 [Chryseobacterium sp.]
MKLLKTVFSLVMILSLLSCGSDDDICTSGEATPRMKLKFKTQSTGKAKTLDSVFVYVDYGNGMIPVEERKMATDSVFVPLRVDEQPFTDVYVGLSKAGAKSKIRVSYVTKSEYVSPACGIKKIYENVTSALTVPTPVLGLDQQQTQITDENKTHIFLLF